MTYHSAAKASTLASLLACIVAFMLAGLSGCSTIGSSSNALPRAAPGAAQRNHVLRTVADFKHLGFQVVAARLNLGIDTALAWRQLDTLLAKPTGDIFWMYPAVGFYFNAKSHLDAKWRARFRDAWKTYTPYRGDTENHFLMYYASLLLMSQEWPDLGGSEWFNGKSSRENYDEAREYLDHWIDETVLHGSTEWDSPRYAYYYITPLVLLRDFASDPVLQRRYEMMLELTLADYAADYLNGSYCGAHSRDGDGSVIDPRKAEVTSYGQLYFTDSVSFVLPDLAYAAMSNWQCPPIIRAIAHDRSQPYVHNEMKRSRAMMRYSAERYSKVFRYNYMTPDYCLGSIQGGVHQPIQQHTWDVTFASERPNNTLFALHPTWSARELGTFFPEEPALMVEGVARAKASYTNENKWIGGSPYEWVAQDSNVLVAVYDIPDSDVVRHVDMFVPSSLDKLVRDTSGWVFAQMDNAMVGIRIYADSVVWITEPAASRLRIWPGGTRSLFANASSSTVAIVVVTQSTRQVTWEAFMSAMVAEGSIKPTVAMAQPVPGSAVAIASGDGATRTFVWRGMSRGLARIGGALALPFNGPHVTSFSTIGTDGAPTAVKLHVDNHWRILDFSTTTVSEARD